MAVTLREVAARAGVSPITVSRALNNTGYVSQDVRVRVLRAAEELNYVPNAVARSLRSKKTQLIALLAGITNPFWASVARGIEDKLSDALHQALMLRFVDRRTSALLKTLNSEEDAPAEIGPAGEVVIGGHKVGHLDGLAFSPDATGEALAGRALRGAALKSLRPIIERRLADIASAPDADLSFDTSKAQVVHNSAPIAKRTAG